jgi:hypothetical protein
MRIKALASIVFATLLCAALSTQAVAQAEKRMAGGSKSVTGCIVKTDSGFGIKTDEGTYQLNTDRDLSNYVGKQVRVDGTWRASGTFTTAPVGGVAAGPGGGEPATAPATSGAPGAGAAGAPAFVGELNLQITGTVVGDCGTPK